MQTQWTCTYSNDLSTFEKLIKKIWRQQAFPFAYSQHFLANLASPPHPYIDIGDYLEMLLFLPGGWCCKPNWKFNWPFKWVSGLHYIWLLFPLGQGQKGKTLKCSPFFLFLGFILLVKLLAATQSSMKKLQKISFSYPHCPRVENLHMNDLPFQILAGQVLSGTLAQ